MVKDKLGKLKVVIFKNIGMRLTSYVGTWICQEAIVAVDREGAEASGVRRRLPNRVQDFHVSNVVYEKGVLETHNEARPVHLDSQDRVGVAVVAYLGPLLEVANSQLSWLRLIHQTQQRAGKQTLHDDDGRR